MTPCIEWAGARDANGYGQVRHEGRTQRPHRVAWIEAYGPIRRDQLVCHRCDNPACYNLDHLFLGTHTDNMRDMASKGRHWATKKTHCINGHQLGGGNLLPSARPGTRRCRECANRRARECLRRKAAEARSAAVPQHLVRR